MPSNSKHKTKPVKNQQAHTRIHVRLRHKVEDLRNKLKRCHIKIEQLRQKLKNAVETDVQPRHEIEQLNKQLETASDAKVSLAMDALIQNWRWITDEYNHRPGWDPDPETAERKYIDSMLQDVSDLLSREEKAKVAEKFYSWLNGDAEWDGYKCSEDFTWHIKLNENDKQRLLHDQHAYQGAKDKSNGTLEFEPPDTFGQTKYEDEYTEDERTGKWCITKEQYDELRKIRRKRAWNKWVKQNTIPNVITAAPNPFFLDLAI